MQRERQAILSLIALDRITPREAERMLIIANTGREELWVMAACAAAGVAQFLPTLPRLAHAILSAGLPGLHHAVMAITYWMGGVL